MPYLVIENLTVKLMKFTLQLSLSLERHEVLAVLGPSGSGKTVLLETIAGFQNPVQGSIALGGNLLNGLPPEKRKVGFVFQEYALFPHLNVRDNIFFSPRLAKNGAAAEKVRETMDMLKISHLAGRKIQHLSGGERQRVALARALVSDPQIMLLDEPMSALDAVIREELREELSDLFHRLGTTAVYVTHDRSEAFAMGDRIAVINSGRLEQLDTPENIFRRPDSCAVAKFVGMETIFPATVKAPLNGEVVLQAGPFEIRSAIKRNLAPGEKVFVGIRPEEIKLDPSNGVMSTNRITAPITGVSPQGPFFKVKLDCGFGLVSIINWSEYQAIKPARGMLVTAAIDPGSVHIMTEGGEV